MKTAIRAEFGRRSATEVATLTSVSSALDQVVRAQMERILSLIGAVKQFAEFSGDSFILKGIRLLKIRPLQRLANSSVTLRLWPLTSDYSSRINGLSSHINRTDELGFSYRWKSLDLAVNRSLMAMENKPRESKESISALTRQLQISIDSQSGNDPVWLVYQLEMTSVFLIAENRLFCERRR